MIGHRLEGEDIVGRKGNNRNVYLPRKKADISGQEFGLFCLCADRKKGAIQGPIQSIQHVPLLSP
jgi:hypothetical protein